MSRDPFGAAIALVLHDLESEGIAAPTITVPGRPGSPGQRTATVHSGDGTSTGIWAWESEPPNEQIVRLADHIQEWAVEWLAARARPATWPMCPAHPNSHPLRPVLADRAPVWVCPQTEAVISRIGELSPPQGSVS